MSPLTRTLLAAAVAGVAFSASAQQAADHSQHHPATPTATAVPAPAAPAPAATPPQTAAPQAGMSMGMSSMPQLRQRQRMQQHMTTMQSLRTRMAAATTPAERDALMDEHMKAMQEGMDMMEMMMQRMPQAPAGAGTQ